MGFQVQILNKQRQVKFKSREFKSTAEALFSATLEQLSKKPCPFLNKTQLKRLKSSGVLSVALVSNGQIRKLNKKWRNIDKETDVLSFTLDLEPLSEDLPFEFGELVISAEKALSQSKEFGHSFEREMAFLFVHGVLHVLGFDHENPEQEKDMFGRQKEILISCKLSR